MYIRKQNIFTENKVYPYVVIDDLRLDLLPRLRQMAVNNAGGSHPWENMNDQELLQSAGLYSVDRVTGERGYNLAAVMLLGKDNVILDCCPAYETDALVRKVNIDRYDDREIVRTNLIESYELLLEFAKKHLPDKFYLEGTERKSLRNIIAREMLVNMLIHREFSSTYTAKFIIEENRMYVENANRSNRYGVITPDNLEPNPKNPIIASFFRNIGWSDRLGSGVRNLFKYCKFYSGQEPEFIEGDICRIIVPLNNNYSYDKSADEALASADKNADKVLESAGKVLVSTNSKYTEQQKKIMDFLNEHKVIRTKDAVILLSVKERRARDVLSDLVTAGVLSKRGAYRSTTYVIKHRTLEERAAEFDGKIGPYDEYAWGQSHGRERW